MNTATLTRSTALGSLVARPLGPSLRQWRAALGSLGCLADAANGTAGTAVEHPLRAHGVHAIAKPARVEVECVQGCLWLTHDGDCRDLVLHPGQRYLADRGTRLLVSALEPSLMRLHRRLNRPSGVRGAHESL